MREPRGKRAGHVVDGDGARDRRRPRLGRPRRPARQRRRARRARRSSPAAGSVLTESWARAAWGWLLLRVDPTRALAVIENGLEEARRIDYPVAVAVDLRSLSYAHLLLGDIPAATAAANELLDDLLTRGALSNSRLLVDVTAVLAHRCGHPAWATLAATAHALPITTLAAAHHELVPLPDVDAPALGRHDIINTVRTVLEQLTAQTAAGTDVTTDRSGAGAGGLDRAS